MIESLNKKSDLEPLELLIEGNKRYVQDRPLRRNQDAIRREALVTRQHPFAIVLSCSDSRVPPEIIFDQGLGDIFTVRIAGNVLDPTVLDSIEFAADFLKALIIIVLGHQNCGAIAAVLQGGDDLVYMKNIAPKIYPAIERSKTMQGDRLTNAVKMNALMVAENLKTRPLLKKLIEEKQLQVFSAYYSLETGEVQFLKPSFSI